MRKTLQALTCSVFVLFAVAGYARAQDNNAQNGIFPEHAAQPDGEQTGTPSTPPAQTTATTSGQTPTSPTPVANTTQNSVPPVEHTGLRTLVRDTYRDFLAFPTRESTWWILGIGGGLAAAVHPFDDDVNAHLASSGAADNIWKAGHIIGGPVMYIAPVAVYVGGRYVLPKFDSDDSQTNKWSHVGLDLVRAEILEEVIVQGIKVSVRRTRPNGSPYSFPSGHAAATFALAAVIERHLGYR